MKKQKPAGRPLSNAERQRRFRERRDARLSELERLSLRNEKGGLTVHPLRNAASNRWTEETIDDALTQLRRRGDQLAAGYVALLATPGLTAAETQTVRSWFLKWRQLFDANVATSRRRLLKPKPKGGA